MVELDIYVLGVNKITYTIFYLIFLSLAIMSHVNTCI